MAGKSSAAVVTATCLCAAICIGGLYFASHGITLFAAADYGTEERIPREDIKAAVQSVKSHFRETFDGCVMKTVEYDADETETEISEGSYSAGTVILRSEYLAVAPFSSPEWGNGPNAVRWIVRQNSEGNWDVQRFVRA